MQRFTKLSELELTNNEELEIFCKELQAICRELFAEVYYSAAILQQNIATMRHKDSKKRAKKISRSLEKASTHFRTAGGYSVETWKMFQKLLHEELESRPKTRRKPPEPTFVVK